MPSIPEIIAFSTLGLLFDALDGRMNERRTMCQFFASCKVKIVDTYWWGKPRRRWQLGHHPRQCHYFHGTLWSMYKKGFHGWPHLLSCVSEFWGTPTRCRKRGLCCGLRNLSGIQPRCIFVKARRRFGSQDDIFIVLDFNGTFRGLTKITEYKIGKESQWLKSSSSY